MQGNSPSVDRVVEAALCKQAADVHAKSIALMKFLSAVARRLEVGEHIYVVGGAVRNFVLSVPIKDVDVVVDSVALKGKDSEWFAKEVQRVIPTHSNLTTNNYGVAILTVKGTWILDGEDLSGEVIEIANARKESYGGASGQGYKPHTVEPATIQDDAARREFTCNTLLFKLQDLADGPDKAKILDLTGHGLEDLKNKELRCPRDPDVVFSDDPSRLLRAIKFAVKYGFTIPPDVEQSIRKNAPKLKNAPYPAISNLLIETVLGDPHTAKASLLEMKKLGLLDVVSEMIQGDVAFHGAMAGWAKEQRVSLLFDLMDLGVPLETKIDFLNPEEQNRLRTLSLGMREGEAEAFVEVLRQPGKAVDMPALIREFKLKGPQITAVVSPIVRELLLGDPALAKDKAKLTDMVRQRLQGNTPPGNGSSGTSKTAGSRVKVLVDVPRTLAARQKYALFPEMVIAKFDQSVAMYRVFDGEELRRIVATGKITGGNYAIKAERDFGASWGHDITGVIQGIGGGRGTRIGETLFLAKIDALDRYFAHLDPQIIFDPHGLNEQEAWMDPNRCSTGLGCSIMDVSAEDVDAFFLLRKDGQIEPKTFAELKGLSDSIPLKATPVPSPIPPMEANVGLGLRPKDRFVVVKGSVMLGAWARMTGVVTNVSKMEGDSRVEVTLSFTYPLKPKTRSYNSSYQLHLYAVHANRLQDDLIPLLDSGGNRILIRKRPPKILTALLDSSYKTKDGRSISFDIVEQDTHRADPKSLFVVHRIDAFVDGKKAGYIRLMYVPSERLREEAPTLWDWLTASEGLLGLDEIDPADRDELWDLLANYRHIYHLDVPPPQERDQDLREWEAEYTKRFKAWEMDYVNKPRPAWVSTEEGEFAHQGVGFALYQFAAQWLAKRRLKLYAAWSRSPSARSVWDKMENRGGLPVQREQDSKGQFRQVLDYRTAANPTPEGSDYFTNDGLPITFKTFEDEPEARPDNRGFKIHQVNAYVGGQQVGYLKISYIPKAAWKARYPDLWRYLAYMRGWAGLRSVLEEKPVNLVKLWAEVMQYSGRYVDLNDIPSPAEQAADLKRVEKQRLPEFVNYRKFVMDKPMVDYIRVFTAEDKNRGGDGGDWRRKGIAAALYQYGARWMASKGLPLYASGVQSDAAQHAWDWMRSQKQIPIKIQPHPYPPEAKGEPRQKRYLLDYRTKKALVTRITARYIGRVCSHG